MTREIDYAVASSSQVSADIGFTLARIRLSRNLLQVELAKQAGVSERTVKRLEAGKGATLDTFIRLMQALGLSNLLEVLLPNPEIQPVQTAARGGQPRQRARGVTIATHEPWSWDEELAP